MPETSSPEDADLELPNCGCCGSSRGEPVDEIEGFDLVRCVGCGVLRFTAITPPEAVYTQGYHTGESTFGWDSLADGKSGYEGFIASRRLDLLERFSPRGRLVDVGGGLGFFTAAAAERGWEAELLEPVAQAVEFARGTSGITATEGGIDVLGARSGSYDAVCLFHCIEHLPDARQALALARGALAPGGILFVEVPNYSSVVRRLLGDLWHGWQAGEHAYVFTRQTLSGLLRRSGFRPLAIRTFVPGWDGLEPDTYAFFLGMQRVLARSVGLSRRWSGRVDKKTGLVLESARHMPVPIREQSPGRRLIYRTAFGTLARIEQIVGMGTNLQIVARPIEE